LFSSVWLAGGLNESGDARTTPKAQTQNHSPVSSTRNLSPRESSEIVPSGLDQSENVIFAPAAAGFCVCAREKRNSDVRRLLK